MQLRFKNFDSAL